MGGFEIMVVMFVEGRFPVGGRAGIDLFSSYVGLAADSRFSISQNKEADRALLFFYFFIDCSRLD